MSKKKLFSALCLILAALVLPACSGGEKEPDTLTFTVPETFTSGSEGQFDVTMLGLTSRNLLIYPGIGIELKIQSTDGLYYLFGDTVWEKGLLQSGEPGRYGTVEREEGGEWVACGSVFDGSTTSTTSMGYGLFVPPPRVHGRFIRPYEAAYNHQYMRIELSDTLPGRYRVHVAVQEYSPKWGDDDIPFKPLNGEDPLSFGGTTGEATDEIVFEFDIPRFESGPLGVLGYTLSDESRTDSVIGDRAIAYFDLLLHANGDIRYLQNDSVKFEYPDGAGYSEVPDGVVCGFGSDDYYNYPYRHLHDKDGIDYTTPDVVPIGSIIFRDWDRDTTYRLSMTFTENEDGSGETYTLYLYLNFAETAR